MPIPDPARQFVADVGDFSPEDLFADLNVGQNVHVEGTRAESKQSRHELWHALSGFPPCASDADRVSQDRSTPNTATTSRLKMPAATGVDSALIGDTDIKQTLFVTEAEQVSSNNISASLDIWSSKLDLESANLLFHGARERPIHIDDVQTTVMLKRTLLHLETAHFPHDEEVRSCFIGVCLNSAYQIFVGILQKQWNFQKQWNLLRSKPGIEKPSHKQPAYPSSAIFGIA